MIYVFGAHLGSSKQWDVAISVLTLPVTGVPGADGNALPGESEGKQRRAWQR